MTTTGRLPVTPGRVTALVLGLPVALALISVIAVSIVAQFGEDAIQVDQTVALPAHTARVSVGNADVTLRASTGVPGRVRVHGTVRGAFVRPTFGLRRTASGVAINNNCSVPTGTCSGDLDVDMTVPPGLPIAASDVNGDLTASALTGRVTLSTGSGDLRASRVSGPTLALSANAGELIASSLSGSSVRLSNGTGDITASAVSANSVDLTDTSGGITVTGLAGTAVTGSAGSGDVTLTFTKVPRRVEVTDTSGNVTLVLPGGPTYYEVNAQTTSGNISIGVKRRSSSPYVITATTGSGDITIVY